MLFDLEHWLVTCFRDCDFLMVSKLHQAEIQAGQLRFRQLIVIQLWASTLEEGRRNSLAISTFNSCASDISRHTENMLVQKWPGVRTTERVRSHQFLFSHYAPQAHPRGFSLPNRKVLQQACHMLLHIWSRKQRIRILISTMSGWGCSCVPIAQMAFGY